MTTSPMSLVLSRVTGLRKVGGRYVAICPGHDDQSPSLSIDEGDDGRVLITCRAGCSFEDVIARLSVEVADLFPSTASTNGNDRRQIVAEYSYCDEAGRELFQVVRFSPKAFVQRHHDPDDPKADREGWAWHTRGVRRVLYRLPDVLEAVAADVPVWIVEGEKDVAAVDAAGEVGTCCPGGAGKWRSEYAEFFTGADVIVVADQDGPGIKHAADVEASLLPVARSVRVVRPAVGKDAYDHLSAGYGMGDFVEVGEEEAAGETPAVRATSEQFFTERGVLITARIGEAIRSAGNLRTGRDGRLWRYVDGVYRGDGEVWARAQVRKLLGERVTRNHFSEVLTWLGSFEPTVDGTPPTGIINVANGLLDWRTGELAPHDPDVITTVQLPVAWDPAAKCPRTTRFLEEVMAPDAVEIAVEVLGYALYAGNPFRKAVLLLGGGGNGKSRYLGIVTGLLGAANYASVPVQVFGENRFASAELFGKLANVAGDLDARAIKRSDVFKMITGGDPIMAERKNCHPFKFVSYALPLFSANEPPISSDQTQAWFDRWLILPMERRIEGTEMCDPHLALKLSSPAEMQGALVLAVGGLRRLMERGRFSEPATVVAAGEQYRDRLDSARGFVTDACVLHLDAWTPRAALYKAYKTWCVEAGKYPVSAENFYARLRMDYPGRVEERGRQGVRGWAGIGLAAPGLGFGDG